MGGSTSGGGPRLVGHILAVPSGITGAERRRARTLLGISSALAVAALPVAVLVGLTLPDPRRSVPVVLVGLVFYGAIRALVARSHSVAAAWVFLGYFVLVPVNGVLTESAPLTIDVLFVPVIPILAALVLPLRHVVVAFALAVLELGLVAAWSPDAVYVSADLTVYVVILLSICGSAALALSVIIDGAFVEVDTTRVEAQRLADELQVANSELEVRVRSRTLELAEALQREQRLSAQLAELSVRDSLTGLHNRRHMDESIDQMFSYAQRSGSPLSVAIIDLDDFKRINDEYTHLVGDEVLREASTVMAECVRGSDELVRMGGEEFALLMPGTSTGEAVTVCERMRHALETHDWSTVKPGARVTASFGVATSGTSREVSALLRCADEQLLRAKRSGKNRVLCAAAEVA
jgi:diguanylate cyclase (GGDEF)-like protein